MDGSRRSGDGTGGIRSTYSTSQCLRHGRPTGTKRAITSSVSRPVDHAATTCPGRCPHPFAECLDQYDIVDDPCTWQPSEHGTCVHQPGSGARRAAGSAAMPMAKATVGRTPSGLLR
jgi:hypothetical protein